MPSRARAASRLVDVLDASILQLLAVPARVDVLRVLLVHGGADVGTIASHLPLDRSVVSRHLKAFDDAGLVRVTRDGRH
ncbi:MAG: helix-turn-helix domain-containing protein, partial [Deltaproteobacteria bacterium]|nr:helix-turn-helix domain-containing protein [Kofleriaceae bacterium]